jgi:hypothetical protein
MGAFALSIFARRLSAAPTSARSMMRVCFSMRSGTSSPRSRPSRSSSGRSASDENARMWWRVAHDSYIVLKGG